MSGFEGSQPWLEGTCIKQDKSFEPFSKVTRTENDLEMSNGVPWVIGGKKHGSILKANGLNNMAMRYHADLGIVMTEFLIKFQIRTI